MAPVVTQVSPVGGPTTGGTRVVITGSGFTPATEVKFGDTDSLLFRVDSDTQITTIAPSLPAGAPEGIYPVVVSGPSGTSPSDALGAEFTYAQLSAVTTPAPLLVVNPLTPIDNLRLLVGERIGRGQTEADTRFTDDELADTINSYSGNLYLAAGEVWAQKAAMFASLTDISESGSERKLSQLFRQANQMSKSYNEAGIAQALEFNRPVAKTAAICDPRIGSTFDGLGVPSDLYSAVDPYASGTARFWPRIAVLI